MKKVLTVLAVVGVMLAVTVSGSFAMPSGTWVSGVTVANLSSETATVMITFYNPNGSVALDFSGGTIAGNSAKSWYLPAHVSGLADGFVGSAVVLADQPVAATVNTQLPSGTNPMRTGQSTGVGQPAPTVYATQLMKNYYGWNSYCGVQNAGATGYDVTAEYYDASGALVDSDVQAIPAFASHIFDQSIDAELGNNSVYSAKFIGNADHPLGVVCNFYNSGTNASTSQFQSYNGISQGGDVLYVPRVVKDYYNYQSGLRVQNVGTVALDVTVTYSFGGSTYAQVSPSIGPGQAWGPYMGSEAQLPPSMAGVSGSGSAVVAVNAPTADKAIIATVNEDNRVNPAGLGVTYEAALGSEASGTLVFPQVVSEFYGYSSGIQVAKVEAGTSSCQACFATSASISGFCDSFSLTDAVPSWSQFAPSASGMIAGTSNDNYNGSVTVTCTGAPVIGITNMSFRYDRDNRYGNLLGDSFTTARGINQ